MTPADAPLTMSAGWEAEKRFDAEHDRMMFGGETLKLFAEIDALRAKQESDAAAYGDALTEMALVRDEALRKLAASQAAEREARELLAELLPAAARGRSCAHTFNDPCSCCAAREVLARPAGSQEALRELCEKVAVEAGQNAIEMVNCRNYLTASEVVARILGDAAAAEGETT